jgi:hypothetical protein
MSQISNASDDLTRESASISTTSRLGLFLSPVSSLMMQASLNSLNLARLYLERLHFRLRVCSFLPNSDLLPPDPHRC